MPNCVKEQCERKIERLKYFTILMGLSFYYTKPSSSIIQI